MAYMTVMVRRDGKVVGHIDRPTHRLSDGSLAVRYQREMYRVVRSEIDLAHPVKLDGKVSLTPSEAPTPKRDAPSRHEAPSKRAPPPPKAPAPPLVPADLRRRAVPTSPTRDARSRATPPVVTERSTAAASPAPQSYATRPTADWTLPEGWRSGVPEGEGPSVRSVVPVALRMRLGW